jgi:hypothetical protein
MAYCGFPAKIHGEYRECAYSGFCSTVHEHVYDEKEAGAGFSPDRGGDEPK